MGDVFAIKTLQPINHSSPSSPLTLLEMLLPRHKIFDNKLYLSAFLFFIASLRISPQQGNMLGGTLVSITGPCFQPSDDISCMFEGSVVQGIFISGVLAACVTPYLERRGWGDLTVTVGSSEEDGEGLMIRYSEQTRFYASKQHFRNLPFCL